MEKSKIRQILRENLDAAITEAEAQAKSKNYDKSYSEVQRKLDGTLLKASQVFHAAGLGDPDDATSRSLNAKKLKRETNDQGGTYQFDEVELAKIIKVINNPSAYLNTKKQ